MNPSELSLLEKERQTLLQQLTAADAALRANLHMHCVDETGRAHMERALAHVREAYIAINEVARARTVQQLVSDVMKIEHLFDKLRQQPPPGVVIKSVTH
jgi:hypothetical protein